MILRVGVDMVEIARIVKAVQRSGFVRRVLTDNEQDLYLSLPAPRAQEWLAGRWAAKEAIAKCFDVRPRWQDVEVLPGPRGGPLAHVSAEFFNQDTQRLHVSISHDRGMALAFAVLETTP